VVEVYNAMNEQIERIVSDGVEFAIVLQGAHHRACLTGTAAPGKDRAMDRARKAGHCHHAAASDRQWHPLDPIFARW
jgi:hypothetical protein